jgi:hypothetical protein
MTSNAKLFIARLVTAAVLAVGSAFGATAEDRIAIKGYDPVAYFTESKPTLGDASHQFVWDGAVYRFASARHLEMFKGGRREDRGRPALLARAGREAVSVRRSGRPEANDAPSR